MVTRFNSILSASAAFLPVALLLAESSAFTAPQGLKSSQSSFVTPSLKESSTQRRMSVGKFFSGDDDDDVGSLVTSESRLTPEGYGFSSPASRVLKKANRGNGAYRASANDRVVDVIAAITSAQNNLDVSLVYGDNDSLIGLFTETDYIKVRPVQFGSL